MGHHTRLTLGQRLYRSFTYIVKDCYRFIVPPRVKFAQDTLQVFHDPRGLRKRCLALVAAMTTFGIYLFTSSMLPQVTTSSWQASLNREPSYVNQLAASGALRDLPVVGEPDGVLNRVVRIVRVETTVLFADPFSHTVYRHATDDEAERTKGRDFAQERFGIPGDHQLMLTFDDGPDTRYTPAILDILSRENVHATFFVLGGAVVEYPDVYKRVVREGHQAANHSWSHPDFDEIPEWRRFQEVSATQRVMKAVNGYDSRVFRIPRGDPDRQSLALMLSQQQGHVHADFDLDTLDWQFAPGVPVPAPNLDGRGHVVLMHDSGGNRAQTIVMLERLIHEAKAQGYTFDTMRPLLPPENQPVTGARASIADYATYWFAMAIWQIPRDIMSGLFWFGMVSFPTMSLLYLVLAKVSRVRLRRMFPATSDHRDVPVSIVVPCYNEGTVRSPGNLSDDIPLSEAVVCRTIDSLRNTSHRNYEIIVVDDGSTDDTLAAANWYKWNKFQRLRVVTKTNGGKSSALNRGIYVANYEAIVILDGDTQFHPKTVTNLVRHFARSRVGAVAGVVKVGNRTRNLLVRWQAIEYLIGALTREAQSMLGAVMVISGACAAVRKSAIQEVGGFCHRTRAEDADATIDLQLAGWKVVQDVEAVSYTEAPTKAKPFRQQRRRWTLGTVQALWKHRTAIFCRNAGWGMRFVLCYTYASLLLPLLFNPLVFLFAGVLIWSGNWQPVALFALMIALVQIILGACAIRLTRERYRLLWTMPFYRPVFELLMAYLLVYVTRVIMTGSQATWGKLKRTNDVQVATSSEEVTATSS